MQKVLGVPIKVDPAVYAGVAPVVLPPRQSAFYGDDMSNAATGGQLVIRCRAANVGCAKVCRDGDIMLTMPTTHFG